MPTQHLPYWFTKITAYSTVGFALLDHQHHYVLVNASYAKLNGLTPDEMVDMNDSQAFGESVYHQLRPSYERAFKGEFIEMPLTIERFDITITLHITLSLITQKGYPDYLIVQVVDGSEHQLLLDALKEARHQFLLLTQCLPEGVLLVESGHILTANPSAARLLGYTDSRHLLGEECARLFINEETHQAFSSSFTQQLAQTPLYCLTRTHGGVERRVQLNTFSTTLFGQPSQIILLQEAQHASKQLSLSRQANTYIDQLTGVNNRLGFNKHLEYFIEHQIPLVMLYLDIDNFKNINNSLGHNIGDKVIKEVSSRLKRLLPPQAILGHLGGDEFGLIVPHSENMKAGEELAQHIIALVNQPFNLHHFTKRLSCSIGCVHFPMNGHNARVLLQNVDTAMYEAKLRGRNRWITFDNQMNKEARMRLWLEIELQKALQQNSLEVWYQPKVNARNFSINGAEALVRWKHPIEGYISPGTFIPVAEKSGLIEHLGRVVMREVFTTVKRWKEQNILPGKVAINLSPEQFGNPQLIGHIERLMHQTGVDPKCIIFELTESAVMSNSEHTLQMLNAIKQLGFTLSIDDFGTGYSSLAYLARFPIDELKIDRTFITDIDTLPKQLTVIENIIRMGKSLSLNVVVEGVENQQQAILLSHLHCHSIQGFHFHHPQPKHKVEELFSQHRHSSLPSV